MSTNYPPAQDDSHGQYPQNPMPNYYQQNQYAPQNGYGVPPQAVAPEPMQTGPKGFFGSLYDFRFASFVTPKLASIFYGIIVVLTTIAGFVSIIVFLTQLGGNDAGEAVLGIISVLIMTPLFHILTRVALESSVAYIRTAENTAVLVEQGNWNYRNQTQQGGPTQY